MRICALDEQPASRLLVEWQKDRTGHEHGDGDGGRESRENRDGKQVHPAKAGFPSYPRPLTLLTGG